MPRSWHGQRRLNRRQSLRAGSVGRLRKRAKRGVDGYLDQVLIDGPGREEHAHQTRPGQQDADPLGVEPAARLPCLPSFSSAILHGITSEVSQRDLAAAAGRMIGAGDDTENLTVPQMLDLGAGARAGLLLTRRLPDNVLQRLQARYTPPTSVSTGISLWLNKRLSSSKTQHLLGWSPRRTDILTKIESGSYTNRG